MHESTDISGPRPEPGVLLGDRYRLVRRIAVGGMGEVWQAEDQVLGRTVAVKVLKDEFVHSPEFISRFRNEARHTAALSHVGIASVFDYGESGRSAYLVMELVPGETLADRLSRDPRVSVATALSILAQTADALDAAHTNGVVHRDVKPGNLMLLDDGSVKVTDFGIARAIDAVPITAVGQVVGTARYMSPEQALGQPTHAASDVYSLGVIGFEMLAGRPPFEAESPIALARAHVHDSPPPLPDTVPIGVRRIIERSLAKSADDRQVSARAFANDARAQLQRVLPATMAQSDLQAATRVMDADQPPETQPMPTDGVKVGAPLVVVDPHAVAPRRLGRLVAAVIALAGIVGLIALALRDSDQGIPVDASPTSTATTAAAATTTVAAVVEVVAPTSVPPPAAVNVDPATLVGQRAEDAQRLLEALGFVVRPEEARSPAPAGTVTSVQPIGSLPPGSEVTITISSGDGKKDKGKDKHEGPGPPGG